MDNQGRRIAMSPCCLSFVAFCMSCLFVGGCCNPALIGALPVTLHPQETDNWCWAASGQMVMDYLGHNVTQCTEANNWFGRTDCCTLSPCPNPTAPTYDALGNCQGCACGGWPEFGRYGFTFKRTSDAPLSWGDLREELASQSYCHKTPFAFTWHWPGKGGHVMVAKGYVTVAGVNYVDVLDPWAPCTGDEILMTYAYYVSDAGHHTHWDDFYDVTYTGGK